MSNEGAHSPAKTEAEKAAGLPEGWAKPLIPEVCDLNPPKPTANYLSPDASVTFVPMPAVNAELGAITKPEERAFSKVRRGYTAFQEGDVIFAKITPCMENGKAAIARGLENGIGFGSTEFHVLRPTTAILPEYVFHFIRQGSFRRLAETEMTGSVGQRRVPADFLQKAEIPLPPLPEQKRIVAKIDELFAQVDASRDHLAKLRKILKRFRQSVLAAACSGRLTERWRMNRSEKVHERVGKGRPPEGREIPDSWNWLLSSHEFGKVTSGSRGWAKYYADDGPIFIRVGNLDHDSIDIDLHSVQHVRPPSSAEGTRTRIQVGDILVSITADVGMIALIQRDIGTAYINQHVALARPRGQLDRRYLAYFLTSATGGQQQFLELQRGATKAGLGLEDIRSVWIARPPLEEQHEIVRRVEALFKLADLIGERVASAGKRADKLTQAVLAKAFRGELVPTEAELARQEGRAYEPASKLLERIRTEREGNVIHKRTLGRRTARRSGRIST